MSKHIPHIAIYIRCCSILRVDGVPDEVVHDIVKVLKPTPLAICFPRVSSQVPDVTDLCTWLIMDTRVSPVDIPKAKDLTKNDKVNMIVPTICHPM
jgi:hypothetical protein